MIVTLQDWVVYQVIAGMKSNGMIQVQLANKVGISEKHLSQLLTGKVEGSISMWNKLLTAVGITFEV